MKRNSVKTIHSKHFFELKSTLRKLSTLSELCTYSILWKSYHTSWIYISMACPYTLFFHGNRESTLQRNNFILQFLLWSSLVLPFLTTIKHVWPMYDPLLKVLFRGLLPSCLLAQPGWCGFFPDIQYTRAKQFFC